MKLKAMIAAIMFISIVYFVITNHRHKVRQEITQSLRACYRDDDESLAGCKFTTLRKQLLDRKRKPLNPIVNYVVLDVGITVWAAEIEYSHQGKRYADHVMGYDEPTPYARLTETKTISK